MRSWDWAEREKISWIENIYYFLPILWFYLYTITCWSKVPGVACGILKHFFLPLSQPWYPRVHLKNFSQIGPVAWPLIANTNIYITKIITRSSWIKVEPLLINLNWRPKEVAHLRLSGSNTFLSSLNLVPVLVFVNIFQIIDQIKV